MSIFFEAGGADFDSSSIRQSRPLQIGVAALFAGRVELSGADSVRVVATNDCSLVANWACFSHPIRNFYLYFSKLITCPA